LSHLPSLVPSALDRLEEIAARLRGKRAAVFLDYDGTLTPIVERPDLAVLAESMRRAVRELARLCTVAVVSGRDRRDVERLVGLDALVYAGSHGFDIAGPNGVEMQHEEGARHAPELGAAEGELRQRLGTVTGVLIEPKAFALAVHYRLVAPGDVARVRDAVLAVAARHPRLRITEGKMVYELRPRLAWDKGQAVLWLLDALHLGERDIVPLYLGDDVTDEDAFAVLEDRGIGILVGDPPPGGSRARYRLQDPDQVAVFLERLIAILSEGERREVRSEK
jgi:alpha,alpha-trehalase